MRIRGQIGNWPVDLTIELAPEEWAQLGRQVEVPVVAQAAATQTVAASRQDDGQWTAAREVLRLAGQMSGPELLDRLEGLAGSAAAGKRLLVRLRHSSEVKVESGVDAPVYHWVG
ncbi:hypothetical protein I5Q41_16470 [Pseudomonas monteilii]|jgi:hypothetical protein|uniref:Uncharacterized protein n=1 Tax=Pseudomonas monteilii TaxID=76759 RepID=A0A3G2HAP0_9PSED|nr:MULTISPECIES: hypothetical protein [Pseudomonas]KPM65007.1 hypothetical protein HB4184_07210 [Pseudomonas putida]AYN14162.1 hypothetical protein CHR29_03000 [Pseudomonas monteilii]AYO02286.1 hypothetical protein D8767_26370 [Pseudomonas sp. LTGT-11-2Z]MBA1316885.1 hypothetical protein [Pseudomonas monteilii]MBA6091665.1 hypothetical protein [Pseudomonas monteilii]